jgi:hypothetical protein
MDMASDRQSHDASNFVAQWCQELHDVPDGCFSRDCLGELQWKSEKLLGYNLIEVVGHIDRTDDGHYDCTIYRTTEKCVELLSEHGEWKTSPLPCGELGHTGFVNEQSTDYIRCKQCNGRWKKSEL